MADYDLSVDFAGIRLKHPIIADSAGYAVGVAGFRRLLKAGASAVVSKSTTWDPMPSYPRIWENSPIPRCYWDDGNTLPNPSSGTMDGTEALLNPGYKRMAEFIREVKPLADELDAHIIGSISPRSIEEGAEMAREFESAGASAIHMDLVCSTASGFRGKQKANNYECLGKWWSERPDKAVEAMKTVKEAVDIPVIPKAYFYQWARDKPDVIRAVEDVAKIDGVSINTYSIPNTVRIDIYRGKPMTYPRFDHLEIALVPLTVGNTYALAKVTKKPILTAGGLTTAQNAIEVTMAGGTAIGFCRSIYKDIHVIERAVDGIEAYMASQALESLDEIRGIALKYPVRFPDGLAPEHEEQVLKLVAANKQQQSVQELRP